MLHEALDLHDQKMTNCKIAIPCKMQDLKMANMPDQITGLENGRPDICVDLSVHFPALQFLLRHFPGVTF